jgi:uncharacterized membrane protein (UPF0127 family)
MSRLSRLPAASLPGGVRMHVAAGVRARLLGLAWLRDPPADGVALLLPGCRSVHTVGMRWALDLVWLGVDGAPVRVDRGVRPWRLRACRRARAVVEVPAGGADPLLAALEAEGRRVAACGRLPPPANVNGGH